ncbi:MAG: ATP-grasp domain-containing protein [Eubacterium sp.]|nr:ATP-grasp domain-containing protein [Eubacterium sp.]
MKKLAIIGASYLQKPLIEKAKRMGIQTHVFAWAAGDVGEEAADFFYPISIRQKDDILDACKKIGIDGICSIASDLAIITVNFVADKMGLVGNSQNCTYVSTNKYAMRECFRQNGDPSPWNMRVTPGSGLPAQEFHYPLVVKPVDRSGSRGVTKVFNRDELGKAIEKAQKVSFSGQVLVEEFVQGQEYSVECISWKGAHHCLAVTKKFTTGSPHYIETAHLEPAGLHPSVIGRIKAVVYHALSSLQIENGASHTELKIDSEGNIVLIEIGGRMGGDLIGSDLVEASTGVDFVRAVIQAALGEKPDIERQQKRRAAAVRFILSQEDIKVLELVKREHPEYLLQEEVFQVPGKEAEDSSTRCGYYLLSAERVCDISMYLPEGYVENKDEKIKGGGKIEQKIEAYQSGNVFDFDDSIILHYYPERIYQMLCSENGAIMENGGFPLLELGLGRGYSAEAFSKYFTDYTVLDGSQEMIGQFIEGHPELKVNIIKTYFEDFTGGREYGAIVMGFVLEHVDNPIEILCKYKSLLADYGSMFIAVPNAESMHRRLGYFAGDLADMQALSQTDLELGHKRYFTVDSLKHVVESAGLSVVALEGLFMKPVATRQMVSLGLSPKYLEALCRLGKDYPQLSNSILMECKK